MYTAENLERDNVKDESRLCTDIIMRKRDETSMEFQYEDWNRDNDKGSRL